MTYQGALFLSVVLLVACGGGSGSDSAVSEENKDAVQDATVTEPNLDSQALDSIYYNRRTPTGFYQEPEPDPTLFQTITHIKNTDLLAPGSFDDTTPRFEVCTNDFSEALAWSEINGSQLGVLVDNSASTIYFQFTRSPANAPQISNIQRVYKCDIIDRSTVDTRYQNEHLGSYTELPQNASNIKQLIEYLWLYGPSNQYGNAVLNTTINEDQNTFTYHMDMATLAPTANNNGQCDRIDLLSIDYNVDKLTGAIDMIENFQRSIYAQFDGFNILSCDE